MKKSLLILENDHKLSNNRHRDVFEFLRTWNGEVVEMTSLKSKSPKEIFTAVSQATDIMAQTAVSNGSDYQFMEMVELLSKVKESKNIYLIIFGEDLFKYMNEKISVAQLAAIRHHNIYELQDGEEPCTHKHVKMDFSARIEPYLASVAYRANYIATAQQRPTGRKIEILACNANGAAFKGLVIGSVVEELDMVEEEREMREDKIRKALAMDSDSSIDEYLTAEYLEAEYADEELVSISKEPIRGVWIWGNGEPIKLVNDCGLQEYRLVDASTEEMLIEILKMASINEIKDVEAEGYKSVLEDEELSHMDKANYICEELNIPKRGNRQRIVEMLSK